MPTGPARRGGLVRCCRLGGRAIWGRNVADLKLLQAGASELGVDLTREQLSAFSLYMNELLKWNQRANLTAITAPDEIQTKHFLDSLTCLLGFPGVQPGPGNGAAPEGVQVDLAARLNRGAGISCVDLGSGAGFPGIPLAICLPEMDLTLVESVGKKTLFLSHIVQLLKLEDARVLGIRAEDLARVPSERERYDVVVVRAVSRLAVVAELSLPLCRVGGRVVAPKKGDIAREIEEGGYAVQLLGGRLGENVPVDLSLLGEERMLVILDKVAPTPHQYPRRAGVPSKRPLIASPSSAG